MDEDAFKKLMFGPEGQPDTVELIRQTAKQIRDDRNRWIELFPKLGSGEQTWNEETLVKMLSSIQLSLNASQLTLQCLYYQATGRLLDNFEMDGLGGPAE